jgi:hypothetical protein
VLPASSNAGVRYAACDFIAPGGATTKIGIFKSSSSRRTPGPSAFDYDVLKALDPVSSAIHGLHGMSSLNRTSSSRRTPGPSAFDYDVLKALDPGSPHIHVLSGKALDPVSPAIHGLHGMSSS